MRNFLQRCKKIEEEIKKLAEYIKKLKYYSNYKNNSILNEKEEKGLDNKIHILTNFFKKTSTQIKQELKEIHDENKEYKIENNEFEYVTRNDRWEVMTKNLSKTIESYRNEQLTHSKEEKERLKSQFLIVNPDATEEELHELVHSDKGHELLEKEFKSGSSSKSILQKAKERNQSIKQILNSINELVALIEELNEMVHNSGKIVENIEIEIDTTKKTIKEANKDLVKARNYQKAAMYIKYIILIFFSLASLIGIIVVIVYVLGLILFKLSENKDKKVGMNNSQIDQNEI